MAMLHKHGFVFARCVALRCVAPCLVRSHVNQEDTDLPRMHAHDTEADPGN